MDISKHLSRLGKTGLNKYASPDKPLTEYRHRSLNGYVTDIYASKKQEPSRGLVQAYRKLLAGEVVQECRDNAALCFEPNQLAKAFQDISYIPIMQTGPHLRFLLDEDVLYSYVLSDFGAHTKAWGTHDYHITYACSTATMEEKSKTGPGWWEFERKNLNLFNLSRKKLAKSSLLLIKDKVKFAFTDKGEKCSPDKFETRTLIEQIRQLPAAPPARLMKDANTYIWKKFFGNSLIQLDESNVTRMILKLFELQPDNFINHLLFNIPHELHRALDFMDHGNPLQEFDPTSTAYFWFVDGERIAPASLVDEQLICAKPNTKLPPIAWTPAEVMKALEEGRLVPNLFLSFLMLTVLPNMLAIGGWRQIVYYPRFAKVLEQLMDDYCDVHAETYRGQIKAAWGHYAMLPTDPMGYEHYTLINDLARDGTDSRGLFSSLFDESLDRTSCSLLCFKRDPIWREVECESSQVSNFAANVSDTYSG